MNCFPKSNSSKITDPVELTGFFTLLTNLSCLLHLSIGAINETLLLEFCRLQGIEIQKACVSGLRNSSILQIMNLMVGKVTIMDPPRLLLFLYPFLTIHLLGVTVLAQPSILYSCIESAGNYTDNSSYKANLNTFLSSLSSNNEIDYGFYNFSKGQHSNKVNAIALCRGDVMPDACRSCLNDSRLQLTKLCPNQKAAIVWYKKCMLRYSSDSIFRTAQNSPSFYMWNAGNNVSNVEEFNQVLGNLMASLRSKVASGDWRHKFATGEANVTSFQSIYGLMQCTPDLSKLSCSNCLQEATTEIPKCCDSKNGGRVVRPSCNLRFEASRFYEFTAANAPATPPSSPPSADLAPPPLTNTTSTQGKNSNTSRTVVLIVVPSAVISVNP